jgi:redox-sensitive bicupin YhaK (pirin superfamily)
LFRQKIKITVTHYGFTKRLFFYLGIFEKNTTTTYTVNISKNGVFLFLIEGEIEVDNTLLKARDAIGITDFEKFQIKINSKSKILLVEVPMVQN